MTLHRILATTALAAAIGCSRPNAQTTQRATPPPSSASTPVGTLALGERITSPLVPLADIAKHPDRFPSGIVATSGKITAVCKEMGCWMELVDASGQAHVKMHGHTFFVPRTAPGHIARVQAHIVPKGGDDDCTEEAPNQSGVARVELDATGVEID
jgi:hypothetical protein